VAFDGMMDEVHAAGLKRGAITVRNTPVDPNAVPVAIHGWLDELEPPVALLCREPYCAQVVLRAAAQRRLRVPKTSSSFTTIRVVSASAISCPAARRSAAG